MYGCVRVCVCECAGVCACVWVYSSEVVSTAVVVNSQEAIADEKATLTADNSDNLYCVYEKEFVDSRKVWRMA